MKWYIHDTHKDCLQQYMIETFTFLHCRNNHYYYYYYYYYYY